MSAQPCPAHSPLAVAAEWAPRFGWRVFPLHNPTPDGGCSCRLWVACESIGKHPRFTGWQAEATCDPVVIGRWAARFPDANAGIATGPGSGLLVLDVDPRHGGDATLRALEREHGELPATVEVLTGGGGRHVYFAHGLISPTKAGIAPGLDIRGHGGLVVAPGSLHASGRRYEWDAARHPDDVPVAPPPAWLLAMLPRPDETHGAARPAGEWRELVRAGAGEGSRNATIAKLAGLLLRHRVDGYVVLELMSAWNAARCAPPLCEREVIAVVDSIAAAELRRRIALGGEA